MRAALTIFAIWAAGLGAAAQFGKISVAYEALGRAYAAQAGIGIGVMVSIVGMVGLIFGTTAGLLVARIGARRAMVGALALGAAVSAVQMLFPPYPVMMVSRPRSAKAQARRCQSQAVALVVFWGDGNRRSSHFLALASSTVSGCTQRACRGERALRSWIHHSRSAGRRISRKGTFAVSPLRIVTGSESTKATRPAEASAAAPAAGTAVSAMPPPTTGSGAARRD